MVRSLRVDCCDSVAGGSLLFGCCGPMAVDWLLWVGGYKSVAVAVDRSLWADCYGSVAVGRSLGVGSYDSVACQLLCVSLCVSGPHSNGKVERR